MTEMKGSLTQEQVEEGFFMMWWFIDRELHPVTSRKPWGPDMEHRDWIRAEGFNLPSTRLMGNSFSDHRVEVYTGSWPGSFLVVMTLHGEAFEVYVDSLPEYIEFLKDVVLPLKAAYEPAGRAVGVEGGA